MFVFVCINCCSCSGAACYEYTHELLPHDPSVYSSSGGGGNTGCGKKSGPLTFFAVFSATV